VTRCPLCARSSGVLDRRKVCHRLAQLHTVAAVTGRHTAHHYAPPGSDRARLTTCRGKRDALLRFLVKWQWQMTKVQVRLEYPRASNSMSSRGHSCVLCSSMPCERLARTGRTSAQANDLQQCDYRHVSGVLAILCIQVVAHMYVYVWS
jgi:hypothetical protein